MDLPESLPCSWLIKSTSAMKRQSLFHCARAFSDSLGQHGQQQAFAWIEASAHRPPVHPSINTHSRFWTWQVLQSNLLMPFLPKACKAGALFSNFDLPPTDGLLLKSCEASKWVASFRTKQAACAPGSKRKAGRKPTRGRSPGSANTCTKTPASSGPFLCSKASLKVRNTPTFSVVPKQAHIVMKSV